MFVEWSYNDPHNSDRRLRYTTYKNNYLSFCNAEEKRRPDFTAKVALDALKGLKTVNQIASETEIHPT